MSDTHVAEQPVVDVLRVATDGGARELLRVVLGEAPGTAGVTVRGAILLGFKISLTRSLSSHARFLFLITLL